MASRHCDASPVAAAHNHRGVGTFRTASIETGTIKEAADEMIHLLPRVGKTEGSENHHADSAESERRSGMKVNGIPG